MVNPSTIGSVTFSLWKNLGESENGSKKLPFLLRFEFVRHFFSKLSMVFIHSNLETKLKQTEPHLSLFFQYYKR